MPRHRTQFSTWLTGLGKEGGVAVFPVAQVYPLYRLDGIADMHAKKGPPPEANDSLGTYRALCDQVEGGPPKNFSQPRLITWLRRPVIRLGQEFWP
jgi:hypothetical protein